MARFVVSAVVGVAVGIVAGPAAGFQAFSLTYGLTGFLDPNQQVSGPRIDDLKGTTAEYGTPIPHVYGHPRVAGTIVWCSDKHEIATTEEAGGKGGPSTDVTTYTYEIDLRIILSANEIAGVRRIWSNGKLVWSIAADATQETLDASQETNSWRRITVYTGASDQMPDPTEEAALGIANCPAYRGRGSVFIEGLNLGGSGFLPNLTFEVVRIGDTGEVGDGLLCHFDSETGGIVPSVLGPDVTLGSGNSIQSGTARFDEAAEATQAAGPYPSASGVSGSLNRSWRFEMFFYPTVASGPIYSLSSSTNSYHIDISSVIGTAAFGVNYVAEGSSGGGTIGDTSNGPVLNEWNHLGIEYEANTAYLHLFCNGERAASLGPFPGGNPFPDAEFETVEVGGSGYVDEVYFHFDDVLYGTTYPVPTEPFSDSNITTLTAEDEPLDEVLTDIAQRSGVTSVDFSSCAAQVVRAIAVTQVTPARSVMELLANGALQEFVEGSGIKSVARGGASAATLDYDELGASTGDLIESLPLKRLNDIELPAQFAISYVNVLNDYQKGTEYSDRLLGGSTSIATTELAIGLTPTEAKRLADVRLMDAVAGIIQIGPVNVTRAWARLEPTDVVTLTSHDGSTFRARILKITDAGGLRTLECVMDDATVINSEAETDDDYESSTVVRRLVGTTLELLDIPILRDGDDDPGVYAAVTRATLEGDWPGAALFQGIDDAGFSEVARYTDRTFIGTTTTGLAAWENGWVFDELNTVTVSGVGELSSTTRDAILNGTANGYVIGDEVLYARTATLVTPGVYTLSGLLRGRRGTEWAAALGSDAGSRVVLLQTSGIRRVDFDAGELGAEYDFRAVTLSQSLGSANTESITPQGIGLKPFAPVNARASRDNGADIAITWSRRTRLSARLTGDSGINVPLGEASESYAIEVFSNSGFTTVLRTLTSTSESVTYTAEQQQSDFGSIQETLYLRIYQISAVVGRGYALQTSVYAGQAQPSAVVLYDGTESSRSVASYLDTRGDGWVMIKQLVGVASPNYLYWYDGATFNFNTSATGIAGAAGVTVTAVGLSLTATAQPNGAGSYAAVFLPFDAGLFERISWTGNGAGNRDIAHNLGVAPAMALVAPTSAVGSWRMYSSQAGANLSLTFPTSGGAAFASDTGSFPNAANSTHLRIGSALNGSGDSWAAFLISGDSAYVSEGTYTGDGLSSGPTVSTGFRPKLLIIRSLGGTNRFTYITTSELDDTAFNYWTFDDSGRAMFTTDLVTLSDTGFQVTSSDGTVNESGVSYQYIAVMDWA